MKKILLNHTQKKTRAVVLSDDELVAYYVLDAEEPHIIGNIYKGRIQNILPGINESLPVESWRIVSVCPSPPKITSWCAT